MILLLAALLQAAPAQPAPPTGHAPPITVTAPAPEPEPTPDEMAKTVVQMQDMYEQSCASREYGAYDDVCDALNKQLRETKAEAARLAKKAKTPSAPTGSTAPR